jgi:hypothetical protein
LQQQTIIEAADNKKGAPRCGTPFELILSLPDQRFFLAAFFAAGFFATDFFAGAFFGAAFVFFAAGFLAGAFFLAGAAFFAGAAGFFAAFAWTDFDAFAGVDFAA